MDLRGLYLPRFVNSRTSSLLYLISLPSFVPKMNALEVCSSSHFLPTHSKLPLDYASVSFHFSSCDIVPQFENIQLSRTTIAAIAKFQGDKPHYTWQYVRKLNDNICEDLQNMLERSLTWTSSFSFWSLHASSDWEPLFLEFRH